MSIKKPTTIITIVLVLALIFASVSTFWNIIQHRKLKGSDKEIPFITSNNKAVETEKILNWVLDNDIKNLKKSLKKINSKNPQLAKKLKRYIKENEGKPTVTSTESVGPLDGIETKTHDENNSENKFSEIIQRIEDKIEDIKPETTQLSSKVIRFKINNSNIYYTGEIEDGKANGIGKGVFDNGNVYEGEWVDNKIEGKGKEKFPDGSYYEGEFLNNSRHGNGTFLYKTNEKYVGDWKNNTRDGKGILYDKKGKEKYKGEWKNDIFIY